MLDVCVVDGSFPDQNTLWMVPIVVTVLWYPHIGMPMRSIFPSADNVNCPSISLEQNGRHPPGEESHPHPRGRLAGEGRAGPQPPIAIGNIHFAPVQVIAGIAIWSAGEVQEQFPICADN